MKVLLLGASGQLGKEWQNMFSNNTNDLLLVPYTSSQLDISQPANLKSEITKQQPDVIINCAAYTKVDRAEKERAKARKVNAEAVANLADNCSSLDIKLVHFSTDYIFAGTKEDADQFVNGYPEDHTANPVNWYGQTKWEGEEAIRESGCNHLIIRVSWLCGKYGTNFVKTMLKLAEQRELLTIVDDQLGSPTYTDNLVQNTFELLARDKEGTYHLSSEGIISWAQFAETIFDLSDKPVEIKAVPSAEYPTEAARPFFSKLSTDKIQKIKGIEIDHWKKGLKRLINNLK